MYIYFPKNSLRKNSLLYWVEALYWNVIASLLCNTSHGYNYIYRHFLENPPHLRYRWYIYTLEKITDRVWGSAHACWSSTRVWILFYRSSIGGESSFGSGSFAFWISAHAPPSDCAYNAIQRHHSGYSSHCVAGNHIADNIFCGDWIIDSDECFVDGV